MPSTPASPTIGRIYAAFDATSHAVFRSAMSRSRGGTVRVDDLLGALIDSLPGAARALTDQPIRPSTGPELLPMANEPAVRELLLRAYQLADNAPLTPDHLLRAALAESATRRTRPPASSSPPARFPQTPPRPSAEVVPALLRHWLALQAIPLPASTEAEQQLPGLLCELDRMDGLPASA